MNPSLIKFCFYFLYLKTIFLLECFSHVSAETTVCHCRVSVRGVASSAGTLTEGNSRMTSTLVNLCICLNAIEPVSAGPLVKTEWCRWESVYDCRSSELQEKVRECIRY